MFGELKGFKDFLFIYFLVIILKKKNYGTSMDCCFILHNSENVINFCIILNINVFYCMTVFICGSLGKKEPLKHHLMQEHLG